MSSPALNLPAPERDEASPYALVGQAHAKPGKAEALQAALLALVGPTRKEDGALQYHVHRDRDDPDVFVFYEVWVSVAYLEAYLSQPYVQSFLQSRHTLLAGDLDVRWLRMASPYQA